MDAPIRQSDIRPGDVIFFPPGVDDPVAKWIAEADTGTFSHCAIALDEDNMINAALRGLEAGADLDAGGVMIFPLAPELESRSGPPWIGRPSVESGPALQRAKRFVELPDEPSDHKSGFSAAKSLLMMAALCAAHSKDQELQDLVFKAGRKWSVESELSHREMPTFICAEFVAYCYDQPFTWGDFHRSLRLGDHMPHPETDAVDEPTTIPSEPLQALPDRPGQRPNALRKYLGTALGVWRELREVNDHTFGQIACLAEVALYMEVHHHQFLDRCLGSGARLAWEVVTHRDGGDNGDAEAGGEPATDPVKVVDDRAIPACLVTPRTLANASWLEWVRPLEVPATQARVLTRG
jgi:hypothetical protein